MSSLLYSKDSTNPYGFRGIGGTGPGQHVVSRFDRYTVAERNRLEQIVTEMRNELTVQIDDTTSIHQQITNQVYVPQTRTNVINSSYVQYEFRGVGLYEPTVSVDGPVKLWYDGYLSKVIAYRDSTGDGTTAIDVKIDGTSVLLDNIEFIHSDTDAVVVSEFLHTFFDSGSVLTVDIVDSETDAEDLIVVVEAAYPFHSDLFTAEFVQEGDAVVTEGLSGVYICPFEADWKYIDVRTDTTSGAGTGWYTVTVHRIDSTESYQYDLVSPGYSGASVNTSRINAGEKFIVTVDRVPTTEERMNLRASLVFDRRTLNYKSTMEFIGDGYYEVIDNWDVPRYIPETITLSDVFISRGTAGIDGSTVVTITDDNTEIVRLAIDSSTTYYDSTFCHTSPNATVVAGSFLRFNIEEVESGTPADIRCLIVYEKSIPTNPTSFADATTVTSLQASLVRIDSTVAEVSSAVFRTDTSSAIILSMVANHDSTIADLLSSIVRLDSTVSQIESRYRSTDQTVSAMLANMSSMRSTVDTFVPYITNLDSSVALMVDTLRRMDTTTAQMAARAVQIDSTVAEVASFVSDSWYEHEDEINALLSLHILDATQDYQYWRVISNANYIVTAGDCGIVCDTEEADELMYIALRPASLCKYQVLHFKKYGDSTHYVIIDANSSETIDGQQSYTLTTPRQAVSMACNGYEWYVVDSYNPSTFNAIIVNFYPSGEDSYTYIVSVPNEVITVNATNGACIVKLPDPATNEGHKYSIKKIDSSGNNVTVNCANSGTIDDSSTNVLSSQYAKVTVISDGSEYWTI